jgi:hypothetical protein
MKLTLQERFKNLNGSLHMYYQDKAYLKAVIVKSVKYGDVVEIDDETAEKVLATQNIWDVVEDEPKPAEKPVAKPAAKPKTRKK